MLSFDFEAVNATIESWVGLFFYNTIIIFINIEIFSYESAKSLNLLIMWTFLSISLSSFFTAIFSKFIYAAIKALCFWIIPFTFTKFISFSLIFRSIK
jgi:hypothetical protein